MKALKIKGGKKLLGEVSISGSKNASLPILISSILIKNSFQIKNIPKVRDVFTLIELLKFLGIQLKFDEKNRKVIFNKKKKLKIFAPYSIMKTMRAGILVLGPLLAKLKKAKVSLPGGCAIGARPVDLHIFALRKLGAKISIKDGYIYASAKKLSGAFIKFPKISVGATETAIFASVLASGKTRIVNAAIEPEIVDLINFLKVCGAKIKYSKQRIIEIVGVKDLNGKSYRVIPDRIEAITYAVAALITKGKLKINNVKINELQNVLSFLRKIGATVISKNNHFIVYAKKKLKKFSFSTKPYPGLPTDIQAQLMALATSIKGKCQITENIFENRFLHVSELSRMGADIKIIKNTSIVNGGKILKGAEVMATDLRASVALILAALSAQGTSTVSRIYHLERGYEEIQYKLKKCGAIIKSCNVK